MLATGDVLGGKGLADGDGFAEQLVQGGEALGKGGLAMLGHEGGGGAEEVVPLPQFGSRRRWSSAFQAKARRAR